MTTARPARADARRNAERLLAAADTVFTAGGTGASLEEVARRAGVGIGTLYRHFPTREALLEALLHDRFEGVRVEAEALAAARPPGEALAALLAVFVTRTTTYRGLPGPVLASMRAEGSQLYEACHRMQEAVHELVRTAQRAGAVRGDVAPEDVLALAGGVAWVSDQVPDDEGRRDRLLALVLDALRP